MKTDQFQDNVFTAPILLTYTLIHELISNDL